jgi:hypothetical protein
MDFEDGREVNALVHVSVSAGRSRALGLTSGRTTTVDIARRDSGLLLSVLTGGWLFAGTHRRAAFAPHDSCTPVANGGLGVGLAGWDAAACPPDATTSRSLARAVPWFS